MPFIPFNNESNYKGYEKHLVSIQILIKSRAFERKRRSSSVGHSKKERRKIQFSQKKIV
jgi:hypothetical protein